MKLRSGKLGRLFVRALEKGLRKERKNREEFGYLGQRRVGFRGTKYFQKEMFSTFAGFEDFEMFWVQ